MDLKSVVAVPGVVKIVFRFSIGTNSNVHSHVYLGAGSLLSEANIGSFATAVATAWGTNLKPWHHSSVSLDTVEVWDLSSTTGLPGVAPGPGIGSRSGDVPFADTALLINFRISRRYRGGKPRVYMPLLNAGDLADNSHWNSTILGNVQTAWRAFITAIQTASSSLASGGLLHCSVSYIENKAPLVSPIVDYVSQSVCNPIPGSQRRRLGR